MQRIDKPTSHSATGICIPNMETIIYLSFTMQVDHLRCYRCTHVHVHVGVFILKV